MKMSDQFEGIIPISKNLSLGVFCVDDAPFIIHAINQHDPLVEAVRLFLAYNDARDDDDVAMMLMYADALKAAREVIALEGTP